MMVDKCIADCNKALEMHQLAKKGKSMRVNNETAQPLQWDAAEVQLMLGRCHLSRGDNRRAKVVLDEAAAIRCSDMPSTFASKIEKFVAKADEALRLEVEEAEKVLIRSMRICMSVQARVCMSIQRIRHVSTHLFQHMSIHY